MTGRGSIGLEAACMGKNVVIAGYAVYEGLGFTIKPSNKKKYFLNLIKNTNHKNLSKPIQNVAHKCCYFFDNYRYYNLPSLKFFDHKNNPKYLSDNFYKSLYTYISKKTFINDPYYQKIDRILDRIRPKHNL